MIATGIHNGAHRFVEDPSFDLMIDQGMNLDSFYIIPMRINQSNRQVESVLAYDAPNVISLPIEFNPNIRLILKPFLSGYISQVLLNVMSDFYLRFDEKEKNSIFYRIPLVIHPKGKKSLETNLVYDSNKQVVSPQQNVDENTRLFLSGYITSLFIREKEQ